MQTLSALLAVCEGNPPAAVGFPSQRPVARSFDVFFDLCLKKNGWANTWDGGDFTRHGTQYDVTVMIYMYELLMNYDSTLVLN